MRIKRGQVWKQKNKEFYLVITGKKGSKWNAKVLTEKSGIYGGTHKMSEFMLHLRYEICSDPLSR